MHYTELRAAYADWQALVATATTSGMAYALLGWARVAGNSRLLLAQLLPAGLATRTAYTLARNAGLGLLEMRPGAAPAQAVDLAVTRGRRPALLATAADAVWAWHPGGLQSVPLRLLDATSGFVAATALTTAIPERLERQLGALGQAGQRQLGALTVAVAGCGGTGSQVALLLALAGVGRLVLIDHDRIEQSNRNRLVAASDRDVRRGSYKTTALARYLRRLTPDVHCQIVSQTIYGRRAAAAIIAADVLVGCTDNEGSRLYMNRLAVQHLVPYIDCGVGIEPSATGLIAGGQVRTVLPGGPCLECYDGIDRWLAARDLESLQAAALRRSHGYGLGEQPAPALPFLNATVAAEAAASVVAIATSLRPLVPFSGYNLVTGSLAARDDAQRNPGCPACAPGQRSGRGEQLPLPTPARTRHLTSIPPGVVEGRRLAIDD